MGLSTRIPHSAFEFRVEPCLLTSDLGGDATVRVRWLVSFAVFIVFFFHFIQQGMMPFLTEICFTQENP
jgi:hypothetical protein